MTTPRFVCAVILLLVTAFVSAYALTSLVMRLLDVLWAMHV